MTLLEKIVTHDYFNEVSLLIALAAFMLTTLALAGALPSTVGSLSFGIFAGVCFGKVWIEQAGAKRRRDRSNTTTSSNTEKEIIPYENWPDSCVACGKEIPDSMELRGQFCVHRDESVADTKAGGLCSECTRTYSTLVDNHTQLLDIYDKSEDPVEL